MSQLRLRIFDGTRQLFSAAEKFLVTIVDGNQTQHFRNYISSNDQLFDGLPFFDNFGDEYRVIVYADGYKQAGFDPVTLSDAYLTTLDLMLVADDPQFNFAEASWQVVKEAYPFVAAGIDDATGQQRFGDLKEKEKPLACLLNLGEAMSQINLSQGTPLAYIKQLRWDAPYAPAQDRFFAWCDPELINQVKIAAAAHQFAEELNPGVFHSGATASWKQIQFGEANVQLTFHEGDKNTIDGVECIMVEPDIDYYKDLGAHGLLEVVPNKLTNSLTEPWEVYVLRWIAGRQAGVPEFAPLYVIR